MLPSFRFHHIGYAVKDIDRTACMYANAGYSCSDTIYDPIQNVDICWLEKEDQPLIELLAPKDCNSPVCRTLDKNGVTPYHICYIIDDMEASILELRKMKYVVVSKPANAVAINNSRVCFLYNKNVGLIELVESPANI